MKLYFLGWFNDDYKPMNLILYENENKEIIVKIIDIGGINQEIKNIMLVTPRFFMSPAM